MGHSFSLLTAALLAATQGADPQIPQTIVDSASSCGCSSGGRMQFLHAMPWQNSGAQEPRPSFFSRIQDKWSSLFGKRGGDCGCNHDGPILEGAVESSPVMETLHRMPSKTSETSISNKTSQVPITNVVVPASYKAAPVAAPQSGPIRPELTNKVGHEQDYSWITGQLVQQNGRWVIYYATPDTVDRFGGHLVLAPEVDMKAFRSGDLVTVHGIAVPPSNRIGSRSPASYRVTGVDLLERK